MEQFASKLEQRLYQQLNDAAVNSENPLQQAQRSFETAHEIIKELKEYVLQSGFSQTKEEIRFFKIIKPRFQKELIFFEELYHLEANKPIGTGEADMEYYSRFMEHIKTYFDSNRILYNYYLSASDHFDGEFFLRNVPSSSLQLVSAIDMDTGFSTPYSSRLAKLLAYEDLRKYLNRKLGNDQETIIAASDTDTSKKPSLVWTDQKVDIMEIIVAIWTRGSVNYGKCSLKQLVEAMEETFHIRIDNSYQILKNMRMRKKERLSYLKKAIVSSEEKMDDTDMNF